MNALVVYDSFFGNTEKIANEIGGGLGNKKETQVVKVDQVESGHLANLDVLVVGSPTRGFQPTPAIKDFIRKLPAGSLEGVKVTAFDTRIHMTKKVPGMVRFLVRLFGYADKPILEGLKKKGGQQAVPTEWFYVLDTKGPLEDGELKRAREWGKKIRGA